jgi:hypothetical protein
MKKNYLTSLLLVFIPKINAQEYFPNNESIQSKNNNYNCVYECQNICSTQIIEKELTNSKERK